jgi:hypothetical protein
VPGQPVRLIPCPRRERRPRRRPISR